MRTRRVFILSPHTLLARGVETLLRGRRSLRVVGTETDRRQGMERIQALHPDVVILGGEASGRSPLADVSAVFKASPGTVVIGLRVGDNLLHVYQDSEVKVGNVEDLIQAIRQAGKAQATELRQGAIGAQRIGAARRPSFGKVEAGQSMELGRKQDE